MMNHQDIKSLIEAGVPNADVSVDSPDGVHFQATIVSTAFEGKTPIQRHRMVNAVLQEHMDSGALHAFSMSTLTPEQAKKAGP